MCNYKTLAASTFLSIKFAVYKREEKEEIFPPFCRQLTSWSKQTLAWRSGIVFRMVKDLALLEKVLLQKLQVCKGNFQVSQYSFIKKKKC